MTVKVPFCAESVDRQIYTVSPADKFAELALVIVTTDPEAAVTVPE
jgi:hypothetical protein